MKQYELNHNRITIPDEGKALRIKGTKTKFNKAVEALDGKLHDWEEVDK